MYTPLYFLKRFVSINFLFFLKWHSPFNYLLNIYNLAPLQYVHMLQSETAVYGVALDDNPELAHSFF